MPVCFRHVQLVNKGNSALAAGRVLVGDSTGVPVAGPNNIYIQPFVPTLVSSPDGVDSCDAVGLTPSEYKSLVSALGAPAEGNKDMNVSADIFLACLMVLCCIGGWIAGAQR